MPVGLEAIGVVVAARHEVLAAAVVTVRPGPVFQRRAPDIAAVCLVEVSLVVRAEVIFQESLVDLLDDGEQAEVRRIEGQLRVGVPRRGNGRTPEHVPGKRLAHLRRIVVHRLEIDARLADQPLAAIVGFEADFPRMFRRAQRPVSAVGQREGGRAESGFPF